MYVVFSIKNSDALDIQYLFNFLKSSKGRSVIEQNTEGGVRFQLKYSRLSSIKLALPPLSIQRKMASAIDASIHLIKMRNEANAKLGDFTPALFYKMFGDPTKNERRWDVVSLETLGTLDRGKSKHRPRNAIDLFGGPYPFIQTGDVRNAIGYIKEYKQTYSEKGLAQSKLWPKGTLCITIAANIAQTAILDFDACFPDSVVAFTANEKSDITYIQALLSFYQEKLEDLAPQAAQKNINLAILRGLSVPCPPKDLQAKFAARITDAQALQEKQAKSQKKLHELYEAILGSSI